MGAVFLGFFFLFFFFVLWVVVFFVFLVWFVCLFVFACLWLFVLLLFKKKIVLWLLLLLRRQIIIDLTCVNSEYCATNRILTTTKRCSSRGFFSPAPSVRFLRALLSLDFFLSLYFWSSFLRVLARFPDSLSRALCHRLSLLFQNTVDLLTFGPHIIRLVGQWSSS